MWPKYQLGLVTLLARRVQWGRGRRRWQTYRWRDIDRRLGRKLPMRIIERLIDPLTTPSEKSVILQIWRPRILEGLPEGSFAHPSGLWVPLEFGSPGSRYGRPERLRRFD